ncbi:MAG: hypothetical protein AAGM36_06240 [Cyanobacteria bacterium J06597_1]
MFDSYALTPLPYPVYFVCLLSPKNWNIVSSALQATDRKNLSTDDSMDYILERIILYSPQTPDGAPLGAVVWVLQTYIQLKKRGLDVRLTKNYVPGAICIVEVGQLSLKNYGFGSYVVACQGDSGRPELCEHRIVQNQLNVVDTDTDHYINLWPQSNIVRRHESRGDNIKVLAYKGTLSNLSPKFKSPEFFQALDALQITFSFDAKDELKGKQAWASWRDYGQVDAVLAVRSENQYMLSIKPATKLINAWLAGSVAILGAESAYQQLRQSELDYFEISSPKDVIEVLKRLKSEPDLLRAVIANGQKRAKEFNADSTARKWNELLTGPISESYERWRKNDDIFTRAIGRPIRYFQKYQLHKRYDKEYKEQVRNYRKSR